MKIIISILFLTSILLFSCQNKITNEKKTNSRMELLPEPDKDLRLEYEKYQALHQMTNDSLWSHLIFENDGCLTGGQHVYKGKFGGDGCVMSELKDWKIFFERDKKQISEFLINKITDDTTKTKIHTCPFSNAMEGEAAVYGLQKMYGLNWYDFDEFKEYQNRQSESSLDNHQSWLQEILKDKSKRNVLIKCWMKKTND